MEFTDEQQERARQLLRAHESWVEMHYDDNVVFRLVMEFSLEDEEAEELAARTEW